MGSFRMLKDKMLHNCHDIIMDKELKYKVSRIGTAIEACRE